MTQLCASGDGNPTDTVICTKSRDELVDALWALARGPKQRERVHHLPGCDEHCTDHRVTDYLQGLVADLNDTVARLTASDNTVGIRARGGETPVAYHAAAADLAKRVRTTMLMWAQKFAAANDHLEFVAASTADMARWMATFPNLLAMHPEAGDMCNTIVGLTKRVKAMVDRAPDKMYLGPCNTPNAECVCTADVYGLRHEDTASCPECKAEWDMDRRLAWLMDQARDQLASPKEISRALTGLIKEVVSENTIRWWATEKGGRRLVAKAWDSQSRPLYRVGDVEKLAIQRLQDKNSKQQKGKAA